MHFYDKISIVCCFYLDADERESKVKEKEKLEMQI